MLIINIKQKVVNDTMAEDIIDLKCRSMRDNLMFFGIKEAQRENATDTLPNEDCVEKVMDFCENILHIPDPKSKIQLDRAHRVGKYNIRKIRPIVVKFKDTCSKLAVKDSLKQVNLFNTDYNVTEQYPQEVRDRRKELIPVMLQARKAGKKAVLVRDKLYINNDLYTPSPE